MRDVVQAETLLRKFLKSPAPQCTIFESSSYNLQFEPPLQTTVGKQRCSMVRQDWWLSGALAIALVAIALVMSGCGGSASSHGSGSGGASGSGGSGGAGGSGGSGTGSGTGSGGPGGAGGGSGSTASAQPAKFVYVPAGLDATIIPFSVDQNTGALTKQPVYQDPDNRSVSAVAATPDGKFLFAS